jgi:hypothetical protein
MEALDVFILFVWQNVFLDGRCCVFSRRAQEQFDEEEARKFKENHKTNLVLMISKFNR